MKESVERGTGESNFTNRIAFRLVFVAQLAIWQCPTGIRKSQAKKNRPVETGQFCQLRA
ncbi:MAG TPA: hypothetical protein VN289_17960 [Paraburkholderia sp.]|jgi:hypothetical protein|nr:hypothetical protein [Paraburkholderia sp.]